MRAKDRANRVAHRVNGAKALLERGRTHHRSAHHMRARLQITAIGVGAGQVILDQTHPLQRHALAHRVIMRAAERLDAMREGIKAGAGGDEFRHACGQLGIANDDRRQHLWVENDLLHVGFGIGDDAGAPYFRAGAGCRRHRDDRRDGVRIGAGPPVVDVLIIPDRARLPNHEGDHLAQIQTRATAEGNHAVMAARFVGSNACFKVLLVRVRINLGEDATAKVGALHDVQHLRGDGQISQPLVCDQEWALDAGLSAGSRQFSNAASAEFDRGRVGPVSNEVHFVTFLRW